MKQSPHDAGVREQYAQLLIRSNSPGELNDALLQWQQVEERSRRGEPRWRRARQARIDVLARLGQRENADKLLKLTQLLYPDWDASAKK